MYKFHKMGSFRAGAEPVGFGVSVSMCVPFLTPVCSQRTKNASFFVRWEHTGIRQEAAHQDIRKPNPSVSNALCIAQILLCQLIGGIFQTGSRQTGLRH